MKGQQKLDIRFSFDLGYIRISSDAIALGYKYWTAIKVVTWDSRQRTSKKTDRLLYFDGEGANKYVTYP